MAADLTKMQVLANIDEADVGRMRPGQRVTFRVDAYPTDKFIGEVEAGAAPAGVGAERRRRIRRSSRCRTRSCKLKPGMTAHVAIEIARKNNVLRIPNAATRFRPTTEMFQVLNQAVPPELERGRGGRGRGDGQRAGAGGPGGGGEGAAQGQPPAAAGGRPCRQAGPVVQRPPRRPQRPSRSRRRPSRLARSAGRAAALAAATPGARRRTAAAPRLRLMAAANGAAGRSGRSRLRPRWRRPWRLRPEYDARRAAQAHGRAAGEDDAGRARAFQARMRT